MISRAKLQSIHQELKSLGTLSVPDGFKYHIIKGIPGLMLGFHGDFAINTLSGNIYWKNGTRWITVFTLLEGKADDITIYTRSLEAPLRPMGDVNIGWTNSFSSSNLINKHVWESKAKYIGSVRISEWSMPVIKIFGKIEKQEAELLTSHTIYIVSKNRPPIKARVDDPTIDTGWVKIYPGVKKLDDVIWESSTVKNQHGKIKRPWSTPRKVAVRDGEKGEPGKKLLLEYNEVENKFVQRYEGESQTTDLATRETIVGTELIQLPGRVSQAETELSNKLNASDIADWAKEPAKPSYTAAEVGARPESWKPSWLDVENKPDVIIEGDSRLTDSRPASDVPAWAKEPAKPTYTASEVGARPESWKPSWLDVENKPDVIIEGDSRLTDARPASDVPAWAKEPAKPTYTASEVGARPESWKPSWLDVENKPDVIIEGDSRLTDSRPASDVPAWAKEPAKPTYTASEVGARPESWKPSWLDVENKPDVIIEGDSRLTDSRPASDVPAWAKETVLSASAVPSLPASKITSGTFSDARIPSLSISKITNLQTELNSRVTTTSFNSEINLINSELGNKVNSVDFVPVQKSISSFNLIIPIEGDNVSNLRMWSQTIFPKNLEYADLSKCALQLTYNSITDIGVSSLFGKRINFFTPEFGGISPVLKWDSGDDRWTIYKPLRFTNTYTPVDNFDAATKKYVDDNLGAPSNMVTTNTTQTISGVKTFSGANTAFSNGITLGSIVNIRPLNIRQNSDSDDVARILCWKTSGDAYLRFRFTSSDGGLDTFSTMLGASRRSASDYRTVLGSATSSSNASIKASLAGNGTFHVAGDVVAFSNNV